MEPTGLNTKKSLEPLLLILQKYGYRVSIEEVYYDKDEEITPWNKWKNISGYRIVGYLDPYQADAVFRMETKDETVEEMVERYEAVGLNTKVIFPMLK